MSLIITRIPENLDPYFTQIETIWTEIEAAVNDSDARLLFLENNPPRHIKVTFIDPVSTSLPSGPSITIDDVVASNGDLILFTNLNSGNNRVYLLSGIGVNAAWSAQDFFGPSSTLDEDPTDGDMVTATKGAFFANQTAQFDGTQWKVNNVVRLFNGSSFWELGSIQALDIINNFVGEIFSVPYAGSEHMIINFSITRGATHETGQIFMSTDGTLVDVSVASTSPGASGIEFQGSISGSDLVLEYLSDNLGPNGKLKYYTQRWSDTIGGPAGIPSYSGTGGNLLAAAGNNREIQYNDDGDFAADSRFQWNAAVGAINLNGMEIQVLSPETPLLDNQTSAATFHSYDSSDYKHVFMDYSLERDGETQAGTLVVTNNQIAASVTNDFSSTDSLGINFFAVINGSDVNLRYTSTSTGFSSILRFATRRWTNS